MKSLPRARSDSTSGSKTGKRTSPSQQIYALSGTAKRMATALRNVFRSETKEEHASKSKEQNSSIKQTAANSTCKAGDEHVSRAGSRFFGGVVYFGLRFSLG